MSGSLTDTIKTVQQSTMSNFSAKTLGAGKAYQSVAQSMAIAVHDATDHLRNLQTISGTAVGVAAAMMLTEEKVKPWDDIIAEAQKIVMVGATNFAKIGKNASDIANEFPSK